jgi:hypothetical protein
VLGKGEIMAETTPYIGQDAYNRFQVFAKLSYNCISHLMYNNELVWKLLKHGDADAWDKPNLTQEEKAAMVYGGQEDASQYSVFLDIKQPDVFTKETSILRITPFLAIGRNRTVGYIEVSMEIFSHHKINHLSNYQTRIDTVTAELMATFNGADVGGLGLLFFDKMGDEGSRLMNAGQIPFAGKQIIFATNAV